jgi:hypothetical protein
MLSKNSLVLFTVCLFFCSSKSFKKLSLPPEKREENSGPDPLPIWAATIIKLKKIQSDSSDHIQNDQGTENKIV